MAEGHDAEKLRDIIESLRCGKQKKFDSKESDDDFKNHSTSTTHYFLGIIIDTRELTLTMPPEKQSDFYNLLLSFQKRKRAGIKQIQSLCGKLNWACQMVKGGRTFLRRLINSISSAQNRNDKVLLNSEFKADISWWINFMSVFNGTVKFMDFKPITSLQTDASSLGGGGYYNGDYFYVNWAIDFPAFRKEHINIKETLAVVLSVLRWGHLWQK
ncbi:unnamed protein product [Mytilus edulis]|uniref:Uncharacterized protein n=1 Tax=Mytilus edulis TaxID=6550 RepID=A0A8S3REG5_MYTED|nr:unnamed protein product [Mytilus edulis]